MVDRSELKRQLEAVVYADGVSASAKLRALEVLTRLEMEEQPPVETADGPADPMLDLDELTVLRRWRASR